MTNRCFVSRGVLDPDALKEHFNDIDSVCFAYRNCNLDAALSNSVEYRSRKLSIRSALTINDVINWNHTTITEEEKKLLKTMIAWSNIESYVISFRNKRMSGTQRHNDYVSRYLDMLISELKQTKLLGIIESYTVGIASHLTITNKITYMSREGFSSNGNMFIKMASLLLSRFVDTLWALELIQKERTRIPSTTEGTLYIKDLLDRDLAENSLKHYITRELSYEGKVYSQEDLTIEFNWFLHDFLMNKILPEQGLIPLCP